MRQLLLGLVLVALCLPASALADVRVSAFYYPWYGTPAHDGIYRHWSQRRPPAAGRHRVVVLPGPRPVLVGRPARRRRPDERDPRRRDRRDRRLVVGPRLRRGLTAAAPDRRRARADGIAVAAHLEPYDGRTVASTVADVAYLRSLGVRTFYVYRALDLPVADWAAARPALHAGGSTLFAQTQLVGAAAAAGFDGVYTYDIVTFGGGMFHRLCDEAHARHLLCAPSVGPGYDARRGSGDPVVKWRRHGATYDAMWRAAIRRARRPRHDHVVQRMARRNADRAGRTRSPARALSLSVVRRRVGPARAGRRRLLPGADALLVATSSAARSPVAAEDQAPRRRPPQRRLAAAGGRGRPLHRATSRGRARLRPPTSRSQRASRDR